MEIGEGDGRAERAGTVLGWFFTEEGDKEAWVTEVCIDTRVEPLE